MVIKKAVAKHVVTNTETPHVPIAATNPTEGRGHTRAHPVQSAERISVLLFSDRRCCVACRSEQVESMVVQGAGIGMLVFACTPET